MPAASRTVRVSTPSIVPPAHASPTSGPWLTRARVGLSPTRPHSLAGEGWAGSTIDGALTRTVRDAAGVLDVISARMPGEPYYAPPLPRPLRAEVGAGPGQLRVGLLDRPSGELYSADPDCREAVGAAGWLLE